MKKFISLFLMTIILFAVSACSQMTDTDEFADETPDIKAGDVVHEITEPDDKKTEESTIAGDNENQADNVDKQVKQVRQCIQCRRVIGASRYDYCDGCRCTHIRGCALPREGRSAYCVSHVCMMDGCTSERDTNSKYCFRHK